MKNEEKLLQEIKQRIKEGFLCVYVGIIVIIFMLMISGCTQITVTKPDATYSVTIPPFVKADRVSISKDGDDYTFDLNKGSTGDVAELVGEITAAVLRVRGM